VGDRLRGGVVLVDARLQRDGAVEDTPFQVVVRLLQRLGRQLPGCEVAGNLRERDAAGVKPPRDPAAEEARAVLAQVIPLVAGAADAARLVQLAPGYALRP